MSQQSRFEYLIDSIDGIVWEANPATFEFSYVSRRAESILGYPLSAWIEQPRFWVDHLHPEDREAAVSFCGGCIDAKVDHRFEYRMIAADGRAVWIRDLVSLGVEDGRVARLFGVMIDITHQKQTEAALLQSQERFELALRGANDGMWDWNVIKNRTYYSTRWKSMLGYTDDEIGDGPEEWENRLHPEDREQAIAAVEDHLAGRTPFLDNEYRLRAKDGAYRWILGRGLCLRDENGKAYRMAGSHTDITERKIVEQDLMRAREEAEAANRAKSEFLANVGHEMRTPLNGVLGMAGLLSDTPMNEEQCEYLVLLRQSASSMLNLINDILDFAKVEAGQLTLENLPFDLEAALTEVVDLFTPQIREKGLTLGMDFGPGTPRRVIGDSGRIRQVVANLLGNAVKFTAAGNITMSCSCEKLAGAAGRFRIAVQDSGIGIPSEKLGRVFERFTQVDSSPTRHYGGAGLGLAISKELVELMDGRIGVDSKLGEGSTFWFDLDLPTWEETETPERKEAAADPVPAETSDWRLRVLVAEDNIVNQKVAAQLLENLGCHVDVSANGAEAVAMAARFRYDIIFMDCQMPEMDGYEATRLIRADSRVAPTPIVAMMASAMKEDRERCLAAGMDDYIAKPVEARRLADAVRRWGASRTSNTADSAGMTTPNQG